MGNNMVFHHIGIACENIEKLKEFMYNQFEIIEYSNVVYDEKQDADLCIIELADHVKIELIAGEIVKKIVKRKQYLYHICYKVENIDAKIKELCENEGYIQLSDVKPACLFSEGSRVVFLMGNLGVIELLETTQM